MIEEAQLNNGRATLEWIPTKLIIPNPLNPRKDDSIRNDEMREIIRKKGWEEPLTAYQRGRYYVVLAGHRRLYVAKQMRVKEIPVFIVEQPKNHQEEIERIGSLQSGRVDWTPYEWASYIFERWLAWGKPSMVKFAKDINMKVSRVKEYITVFEGFPKQEIEKKLENGTLKMSSLYGMVKWMRRLKASKPELYDNLTHELIRKALLRKLEDGLIAYKEFNGNFVHIASNDDIMLFLTTPTMKLSEVQEPYKEKVDFKGLDSLIIRMGILNRDLYKLYVNDDKEKEKTLHKLQELQQAINHKISELGVIE